ncbi:phosphate transport system regulatory protein PhoU [Anoxybacter fermentans]|uniref:Phosphate-specific transport system accessory protein PhoU n=1 Tax=Anoxybacter fermentans TaxID=1323375 RepID=A0A3S9T1N1_9FIRM|nr:phosphate signaling complex protein PhoU [Anoxybacter fermentans]AZR74468.1 phosphate transport system regulatory protein PhoU [Anoxybacter fermentans]
MARRSFDEELNALKEEMLKMGSYVEEAIHKAVKSLAEQDVELAVEVCEKDERIDEYEVLIEEKCIRLIALQQPVAKDLRTIGMIIKIITDLERIGDNACNIARITQKIGKEPLIKPLIDIPRMADLACEMVHQSLNAFVNQDPELAREIARKDDEVDILNAQIFRELLTFMMADPSTINQSTYLLFVGRYLERIADHATNICERIIYMTTGQRESF